MFNLKHTGIRSVSMIVLVLFFQVALVRSAGGLEIPTGTAQLFIGDHLIEKNLSVTRTLHQPKKDDAGLKPILFLEDEFGGVPGTLQGGTILFDKKLNKYVMFATAGAHLAGHPWDWIRLYRFTSIDGLTWTKGDRGNPECVFPRSREDFFDKESGAYASNFDLTTFIYDESDEMHPYKGWIWYAN